MRNLIPSLLMCSLAFTTTVVLAKSSKHAEKATPSHAKKATMSDHTDSGEFRKLFDDWTDAFNKKDLQRSCDLFAPELTADYQGMPTKSLASLHDGMKGVFADPHTRFRYKYKLHNVYRSANLAAARITWYLTITEDGKPPRETVDQELDILQKNKAGKWQVVNYLAYLDDQDKK